MSKIIVVVKKPFTKAVAMEIENDLATYQKLVEGRIDSFVLPGLWDIFGYCNDSGKLMHLMPNVINTDTLEVLVGTLVFFSLDSERNESSLSDVQIARLLDYLDRYSLPKELFRSC